MLSLFTTDLENLIKNLTFLKENYFHFYRFSFQEHHYSINHILPY